LQLFQLANLWIRDYAVGIDLHAADRRLPESELGLDAGAGDSQRGDRDCSGHEPARARPDICFV
jgi:hypothetical protein